MADVASKTRETTKTRIKEPSKFKVVILNDDVTPVEFVIALLVTVFNHSASVASKLTNDIHNQGSAVVGLYAYEIAEQKSIDATNAARNNNFPLQIKIEAE